MVIKTTVSFRQYVGLIYGLLYRKPLMKGLVALAGLLLLWIGLYSLHVGQLPKPLVYQYITLFLIVVVQPSLIYYTVWKNYYSSNHLRETLRIELTADKIKMSGKSFYTEIRWAKIFRVVEQDHWFLIYENNLSAILVDKKDLSKKKLAELKQILGGIPKIPVELKG